MRLFSYMIVAATGCILAVGIFRGQVGVDQFHGLTKKKAEMVEAIERLQSENDGLREEILKLKKSGSYARKVLRDKYHEVEEDEQIIFFAR